MSEINMRCDEIVYGEVLPGISVMQCGAYYSGATEFRADNGNIGMEGRFGLTIANDPFVIFNIHFGFFLEEESIKRSSDFAEAMADNLRGLNVFDAHKLVQRSYEAGFSGIGELDFGNWLFCRIVDLVTKEDAILEVYKGIGVVAEDRERFFTTTQIDYTSFIT